VLVEADVSFVRGGQITHQATNGSWVEVGDGLLQLTAGDGVLQEEKGGKGSRV
jgi:hypothetical protein